MLVRKLCRLCVVVGPLLAISSVQANDGMQCQRAIGLDGKLAQNVDPAAAAEACLAAAAKGDNGKSLYFAGVVLEQGIGQKKDAAKAEDWYRRAAEKGEPQAYLALGRLAEAGKRNAEALGWYGAAAGKQNAEAAEALRRLRIADPAAMWDAAIEATRIDGGFGSKDDIKGSGSGVIVAENVVVTNEHVVSGCQQMTIGPGLGASVVAKDAKLDLAILRTRVALGAPAALAGEAAIAPGAALRTGGYPGIGDADPSFTITSGTLSTRDLSEESDEYWLLTNRIDPGNSGGPLLDETGLVRGVVFASLPVTGIVKKSAPKTREGMAIRIDTVKDYLDLHGIPYRSAADGPVSADAAADLADHIAAVTVLVTCFSR